MTDDVQSSNVRYFVINQNWDWQTGKHGDQAEFDNEHARSAHPIYLCVC